jgi:DGQHR domain-containing protein
MGERGSGMITVPAMRLRQFGVTLYQAILGARDVDRLVRFEVLSYDGGGPPPRPKGRRGKAKTSRVNWELLEKRIAESSEAYQRPVIRKKIAELVEYYAQCADTGNLPAVPGAVLLVSDRRLEFTPTSSHRVLGVLQIPSEGGVLRALDGQHRLLALHQMVADDRASDVQVPAVVFDALAPDQVVELFVTINAKHTKLNPSHLISLAGRRLYPDKGLAVSHDIIRTLNENAESPLHREIKLFGVGHGRVAQSPLADELKGIFTSLEALGGAQSARFREAAPRFFLNYFKHIARVFPRAWAGRKYSIKTATALRAFLAVVPAVLGAVRSAGDDVLDAHAIGRAIAPWGELIGDQRFETEGEWRQKLAGGTRGTVEVLARELRSALRS